MHDREQLLEAFQYLDELRESGRTNMWGASEYVRAELVYPKDEAREVTLLWMKTFDGETSVEDRVNALMENV